MITGFWYTTVYFVEFGFFSTTFSGIEHEEAYSVQVGTISGPRLGFHTVTISLEGLTAGRIIDYFTTMPCTLNAHLIFQFPIK